MKKMSTLAKFQSLAHLLGIAIAFCKRTARTHSFKLQEKAIATKHSFFVRKSYICTLPLFTPFFPDIYEQQP
ncbi:MAG: hypothetical protein EAZ95_01900 [Bacteroidetes bacterium]|nr:MAG: hypothetical protein EAZ95_01900 [Bacteroidota bacterium]